MTSLILRSCCVPRALRLPFLARKRCSVQLNAFPPKPRAFLDLYTSSYHGDPSVTVTLVIKTSVTDGGGSANEAAPNLHIEVFVSGSHGVP
jgi:hypothetical protein